MTVSKAEQDRVKANNNNQILEDFVNGYGPLVAAVRENSADILRENLCDLYPNIVTFHKIHNSRVSLQDRKVFVHKIWVNPVHSLELRIKIWGNGKIEVVNFFNPEKDRLYIWPESYYNTHYLKEAYSVPVKYTISKRKVESMGNYLERVSSNVREYLIEIFNILRGTY